jgi:hypothetical protein
MASLKQTAEPLLNLHRIPKTKQAVEHVRMKLSENKSEEAKSFIDKLLELYLTSPGFNALQLSKVRIKRMKADHYREMLLSLDEELKSILNEGETNSSIVTPQEPNDELQSQVIKLTEDLAIHPTYSMQDESKEFEELLISKNEPELLLYLFKSSRDFYKKAVTKEKLNDFLSKYETVFNQSKNNYLRTYYGFILDSLEQDLSSGILKTKEAEDLFKNLEKLLLEESLEDNKQELLLNILRCGALFPNATELLKTYIKASEDLIQNNESISSSDKISFNCLIALYSATASRPYRLKLLSEAENLLEESDTAQKSKLKISKGIVHLHFGEFDEAKKYFNAAEHLIFKTSWKSIERKTSWKNLCYWRKFIFAEMILSKDYMYNPTMFSDLQKIIHDTMQDYQGQFQLKSEIEAIQNFVSHKWNDATEKYKMANQYYDAPHYSLDYYFNQAMIAILSDKNESRFINQLKSSESLFFSTTAISILTKAKKFFKENKSSDVYQIDKLNENNKHL